MYTHDMALFGGIEAGGTKFVCGIGTCPDDLEVHSFPTVGPVENVRQAIQFFRDKAGTRLTGLGIASFGPIDLDRSSPTYGYITTTPKTAWRNFDLVGVLSKELAVPVAFETDVNAAALAEAEHVQRGAGTQDAPKTVDVQAPRLVVERVEQPAVDG